MIDTRLRLILFRVLFCTALFACSIEAGLGAETVRATMPTQSAWTGQPVPFFVTLYSPGPFDGTAFFDLPDLPQTVILKMGNPVVGSEQVDDATWFTQRHEFAVYTQRDGKIVVPSFGVRFSGKPSFTAAAETMTGSTEALEFESKRPPVSEDLEFVVTATEMTVDQQWQPSDPEQTIRPGDVFVRTIQRKAVGTTAMMLAPVSNRAPDGVRSYLGNPVVEDKTSRGDSTANRVDVIKYQFQRPGTFTLPDIEVAWWDPDAEELRTQRLEGRTAVVESADDAEVANQESGPPPREQRDLTIAWPVVIAATLLGAIICIGVVMFRQRRSSPQAIAARDVLLACRSNDAEAAYAALLRWQRCEEVNESAAADGRSDSLDRERAKLAEHLYAKGPAKDAWTGESLASAFKSMSHRHHRSSRHPPHRVNQLPDLNPTLESSNV